MNTSVYRLYRPLIKGFRLRRMESFLSRMNPGENEKILDIGGTFFNWQIVDYKGAVELLNLSMPSFVDDFPENIKAVVGDGCQLPYKDGEFDICFSNSVIEHVGSFERQKLFAKETLRVAKRIWIQTPAKSFFFEPHYLTPFIHWFPKFLQKKLLRYFSVFGLVAKPSSKEIDDLVEHTSLLDLPELKELFPNCRIRRERFCFMTKSYIIEKQ
jgi:ubiquinone/menaquinone biosynthesis C-methylase UbiE